MMHGSCLCGGIQYEITGPLWDVLNCHCTMCRKAQGAAFRTRALVAATDLRWITGEELLTFYTSSPGNHRGFCRICGSAVHTILDAMPEAYALALGTLDDDPAVKPAMHVFTDTKAPWFDIYDELPQFPRFRD